MDKLIGEEMVFIKPTSSSLALGGIAPSSYQSIMLCEMAGYDYILLETVGVGQSEFLAHNFSDLFLLLMQPAAGDELQGIKRGIMEMADLLLINKADGDLKNQAEKTQKNYKQAISYYSHKDSGWIVKTQLYSSISDEYTTELMQLVDKYFEHMKADKRLKKKRSDQRIRYFETALKDVILQHFTKDTLIKETVSNLLSKVSKQEIHPVAALNKLEESLS